MRKTQAPALLVTNSTNVTYLTGFTGEDSYFLLTRDNAILLSDFRFIQQIEEECPHLEVHIRHVGEKMPDSVEKVVAKAKLSQLAFEANSMTVALRDTLAECLSQVEWVSTNNLVEELREIKDKEEVEAIRHSIRIAERAFEVIRASLRLEQSEKEIADAMEHQIRLFGGEKTSFPPIVAVGERAALPHAIPSPSIKIGDRPFVLIDWGAQGRGYASDLTRVLATAKLSPKLENIYGVVLKAQQTAIDAVKPGALMEDVDAAARKVIDDAGFGKHFGHGLGHGIGLDIHEAPRLAVSEDRPLKAGMVVTIEPGVYLPNWGGVRIEDDVLVTRTGHEVLTTVSKDLHENTLQLHL